MSKKTISRVVKRAVSLPATLDQAVASIVQESGASYSGVVRVALESFLVARRRDLMEKLYEAHYCDPAVERRDQELIEDLAKLASKSWP